MLIASSFALYSSPPPPIFAATGPTILRRHGDRGRPGDKVAERPHQQIEPLLGMHAAEVEHPGFARGVERRGIQRGRIAAEIGRDDLDLARDGGQLGGDGLRHRLRNGLQAVGVAVEAHLALGETRDVDAELAHARVCG